VFFDLSLTKLLVLAVIAVVVFGPDQLPRIASQAGRALREVRRLADWARRDLREGLGPEFEDFDFADLDPRHSVRKHLLEDTGPGAAAGDAGPAADAVGETAVPPVPSGPPPYDSEAT
jgi:sec-independent protein translocase protein TatB